MKTKRNINKKSSRTEERAGNHFPNKQKYDNIVLAVRETYANVDFVDSKVDWYFATMCLASMSPPTQQQPFYDAEEDRYEGGINE